jgi:serine/threonine protein kinase
LNTAFDYESNEQQLVSHLTTKNHSGLCDRLLSLKGHTLKHLYTIRWLYALGSQSVLYLAENTEKELVIVKTALFPYHLADYTKIQDIYRARQSVKRDAEQLQCFHDKILPKYYDLLYDTNPLLSPSYGEEIIQNELFLMMELLQGQTLRQVVRTLHSAQQPVYPLLEWIAWKVIITGSEFSLAISQAEKPCLYSDFKTANIFLTDNSEQPIRIIDAGSLIPLSAEAGMSPTFTWAYMPPEYCEAYDKEERLWPTPRYVMYTLGKTLWQTLTNQRLISGKNPDLSMPILKHYSPALQRVIANLINQTYASFEHLNELLCQNIPQENQIAFDLAAVLRHNLNSVHS